MALGFWLWVYALGLAFAFWYWAFGDGLFALSLDVVFFVVPGCSVGLSFGSLAIDFSRWDIRVCVFRVCVFRVCVFRVCVFRVVCLGVVCLVVVCLGVVCLGVVCLGVVLAVGVWLLAVGCCRWAFHVGRAFCVGCLIWLLAVGVWFLAVGCGRWAFGCRLLPLDFSRWAFGVGLLASGVVFVWRCVCCSALCFVALRLDTVYLQEEEPVAARHVWLAWPWASQASARERCRVLAAQTLNDEIVGFEGAYKYHDYGRVMSIAEPMKVFEK